VKAAFQFAVLALLLVAANAADGQTPIEIPRPEVRAHRISRVDFVRTPHAGLFQGLQMRIEVDRSGAVTSVKVTEGPEEFRDAAVALAKSWRYRPFDRDGQPVPATFTDFVSILPLELGVRGYESFPAVRDWASVKITLERTRCLGSCPPYRVQIDGDGNVVFNGTSGERRSHISREALEGLVEVFRKANYFSLDRTYKLGATDLPTYITSISIDGRSMSVVDYAGLQVGMPASVRDVERAIDEAAGTRAWLKPAR
jgi:hypothetical protein